MMFFVDWDSSGDIHPPIGVSNLAHETPISPESQILVFPQTYLEQDILSEAIDLAKKSTGPSQQTATEIHCSYNMSVKS